MSYYDIGSETSLIDVWTPGDALDDMRALDGGIRSLGEAVAASIVSAKFKAEYALFANEWRAFFEDHSGSIGAWFSRGRYTFKGRLENYQATLNKWRKAFETEGGALSTIPVRDISQSKSFPWGWVLGVAGVGTLAYFAFRSNGDK